MKKRMKANFSIFNSILNSIFNTRKNKVFDLFWLFHNLINPQLSKLNLVSFSAGFLPGRFSKFY